MLRLLIIVFLVYLLYRVVRRYLGTGRMSRSQQDDGANGGPVDEMVQDPVCGTYIPRRDARRKIIGGREYFFCSRACEERFERDQENR
ncbi:MAG: YHS domain-containing protein [Deltaproteobacteria bacterium]|jgi:uncharacterized protein